MCAGVVTEGDPMSGSDDTADVRVAVVTGVSRGIGAGIALRLACDGFALAGCYLHSDDAAEKVRAELEELGARAYFAPCDVRDPAAVEAFLRAAEQSLGPVDTVVNNAGVVRDNPIVLMTDDQWRDVIDINLTGVWNVCRAAGFRMAKRRRGVIVNMSSVAGLYGNAGQTNYSAAKAGIIGMSRSLAKELARYRVRVNVVAPGFVTTDMTASLPEAHKQEALARVPLKRFGTPQDVAEAVGFLVSERAGYITGQVIQVDGGMVL
jgi:3-oxoacyl-[acyl-carrier protein] reductase